MPSLSEMLKQAKKEEATKPRKIIKGIRPDKILRGEITFEKHNSEPQISNVATTQPERSQQPGQNVATTQPERSHSNFQQGITQPERSQQPGQNVATTQPERSQQPGQNVAIENGDFEAASGDPTLLVGTQRKVFEYLFHLAQRYASLTTPRLTLDAMSSATGLTSSQIHSATKHLRKKECIKLTNRKDGRGGWVEYSVLQKAFDTWFKLENTVKRSQNVATTESERSQQPGHKPGHDPSSSSRDLYINKNTTTEAVDNFSFSVDLVSGFGITESAVVRCFELYPSLEREKMQDLINRFAQFMATPDGKRVKNARGFFIGLAEQLSKGITPLDHIETPESRLMRELVEKKRVHKQEQEHLEKEMRDFDFEEWWETLPVGERDALVQPNNISPSGSNSQKILARQVHAEKFWPERKQKALAEAATEVVTLGPGA